MRSLQSLGLVLSLFCCSLALASSSSSSPSYSFSETMESTAAEIKDALKATTTSDYELLMTLNPGCPSPACDTNHTHVTVANLTVRATGSEGSLREHHWVWSVLGHPAVQLALTDPGDAVSVDWAALLGMRDLDSCIQYETRPKYSAAIMLGKLIEFDDVANRGTPDGYPSSSVISYPLTSFEWRRVLLENTTARAAYGFIAGNYTAKDGIGANVTDGILNITISAYATSGYGRWLPHLSHSESTNQMDIQIDGIKTNSGFNHSRFALEMVLVSNAQKTTKLERASTETLDDEHTPGIFTTQELIIPGYNDTLQAYMQWRPVVYTTAARDLSASTEVNISEPIHLAAPQDELRETILFAMYGQDLEDMLVTRLNVTMGAGSDGFYKKTHFQAWTFTIGSGRPIHNGLSPGLVLAITVMFGVMILVLVTAGAICLWKKCRRSGGSYGRL